MNVQNEMDKKKKNLGIVLEDTNTFKVCENVKPVIFFWWPLSFIFTWLVLKSFEKKQVRSFPF